MLEAKLFKYGMLCYGGSFFLIFCFILATKRPAVERIVESDRKFKATCYYALLDLVSAYFIVGICQFYLFLSTSNQAVLITANVAVSR